MSTADALRIATACLHRCDWGESKAYTLDEAVEQVRHPMTGVNREDTLTVIAYLSAQVVGMRRSQDADAKLALAQVRSALAGFDDITRRRLLNDSAP